MKTQVIFPAPVFPAVNQLADVLYSPNEQLIQLETEHEWVTQSWIATSITQSVLAKHAPLPYRWWYREGGRLVKQQALFSAPAQAHQMLHFPLLTGDDRVVFLQKKIQEEYGLTVDQKIIHQALVWQTRYVSVHQVLAESIRVIQRAIQRARVINGGELALSHIADVIGDWQEVTLSMVSLEDYLHSYVIGQEAAIHFLVCQPQEARVFILAGPPHSGRKRFATTYATWLNGAARFCVFVDFKEAQVFSYSDIVRRNPDTVFLVRGVEHSPDRLVPLLQLNARVMILLDMLDEQESSEETRSLETILYPSEALAVKEMDTAKHKEKLRQYLPETIIAQAVPLFFTPLTAEAKRLRIRRALAKQLRYWSSVCGISLYFQEEVLVYLLTYWQVIDDYLLQHVFPLFQRMLAGKVLEKHHALQLQLNETGTLLIVTIVDKKR